MQEAWRPIDEYPNYSVSSFGRVKDVRTDELLKLSTSAKGYLVVNLRNRRGKRQRYVHRLVAEAFLAPDPLRPNVNHIDTVKSNCDVRNLEWSTQAENVRHAQRMGLGEPPKPVYIVETGETFESVTACAYALGVPMHYVSGALSNRRKTTRGVTIRQISEGAMMPQNENITIENARMVFRNFEGREGMYNRAGVRNFAVLLDQDVAEDLVRDGWNIKQLRPREEGDEPQPYISVTVGYSEKSRPPTVVMISSRGRTHLDENTIGTLDWVDIDNVDVSFRPYDWEVNGNKGRKAYLQALYITINEDPLALKYNETGDIASVDGPMMEHTEPLKVQD